MKKTFLLIIIFLFSFQKLLNAVDFGNYLAGESANAKKNALKEALQYYKIMTHRSFYKKHSH